MKGFTLLEILLVVLIISVMTAVGVNVINSQSTERLILNLSQQFADDLKFICEKAIMENQAFGIELHANGYQALRYQQPDWVAGKASLRVNEHVVNDLLIGGLHQELSPESTLEDEFLPHIVCQADGSFNAFELRFSATEQLSKNSGSKTYYALKTQSPWQLDGAWYQP